MKFLKILLLLLFIKTIYAAPQTTGCADMSPADPSTVKVPPRDFFGNGTVTGTVGIATFDGSNRNCTTDCSCEYNSQKQIWEAKTTAPQICIFANQCARCQKNNKTCLIRYRDLSDLSAYEATFTANNPHATVIKKCSYTNESMVTCQQVPRFPPYNENTQ